MWPKFEFNHANCCRIHILFANWCLKSSFNAVCGHEKSYSELRILISPCHVWPKFECTPKFGGETGVFAYFLLSDFHSFCNLGPKVMVQSRMWPEKPHSMQVSNKNYTQQSSDVDSFGLVYAGIYCFAIPAGATRGRMANSWAILCYHTLKHPSIICIPYVMGGGWELFKRIRMVTAPAADIVTLPYLTLP